MKLRIVIWSVACIQLIAGTQVIGGTVLCLGADGHVEIEATVNGKCSPTLGGDRTATKPEAQDLRKGHGSPQSCCVDCVDIPLAAPSATVSPGDSSRSRAASPERMDTVDIPDRAPFVVAACDAQLCARGMPVSGVHSNASLLSVQLLI